jgi:hypothetical protein
MTTAQLLAHEAAKAAAAGASHTAVEILERAAEFAARKFRDAAPEDPHWTPKRVEPQPPVGIERGLVNDAVTPEDRA